MGRSGRAALLAACASCGMAAPVASAEPQTVLVSLSSAGDQSQRGSIAVDVSADGRFVLFRSHGDELVPGDTNRRQDLFLRDVLNRRTERVDVAWNGEQSESSPAFPEAAMTPDARYVGFSSRDPNLVQRADTNDTADAFVRDRLQHTTARVSVSNDEQQRPRGGEFDAMSPDGRFVLFDGPTGTTRRRPGGVFLRDRVRHTTVRVATNTTRLTVFGDDVSDDGRFVLIQRTIFQQELGVEFALDVRLVDVASHTSSAVIPAQGSMSAFFLFDSSMIGDGSIIAVDAGGLFGHNIIVVVDRAGHTRTRLPGGFEPDLSADGRFLTFTSFAHDLVPTDTNRADDVFRLDRRTGAIVRVSLDAANRQLRAGASGGALSADGRFVAFTTSAAAVPGDTNGRPDAYLRGPLP